MVSPLFPAFEEKMDKNFKNPIEPKVKKSNVKSSPWDFRAPHYDERSSCYVDAGTHYGVGYKSPVGHEGDPKTRVDTMPFGNPPTKEIDEVPRKLLKPEMLQ